MPAWPEGPSAKGLLELRGEDAMASRGCHSLLLGVAALLLLAAGGSGSSSPHSLRYFYTTISEPGPGLPQFIAVGYVDDQPFAKYDSVLRRDVPLVSWMEKAGKEDPQYWEKGTQVSQGAEAVFRGNLEILRERFHQNSSAGLHTFQWMYGCEAGPDGRFCGGKDQLAYDGEDFLALDLETITYTARVRQALPTKRKLEAEVQYAKMYKDFLEGECVAWLRRFLGYGKETLLRTETPTWKVSCKKGYDGQEILLCQLYGFYPKDIEVTWTKDGEDRKQDTLTGGVVPNSDGTYHTWLSIEVDPEERGRYRCRVGHDSLPDPLDLAWEEPASNLGLILGAVLAAAILLVGVTIFFLKTHRRLESDYEEKQRHSSESSDSSSDRHSQNSDSSITELLQGEITRKLPMV